MYSRASGSSTNPVARAWMTVLPESGDVGSLGVSVDRHWGEVWLPKILWLRTHRLIVSHAQLAFFKLVSHAELVLVRADPLHLIKICARGEGGGVSE